MKSKYEISYYGTKEWYYEGKLHRVDGPAVENVNSHKEWYYEGKLHRVDEPAVEYYGTKKWYYKGKEFNVSSQEEFERYLKLLTFL